MLNQNFSLVVLSKIVGTILQAVFYFIFASILDPNEYGEMSFLIAIAGTVSIISRFGLPHTITVYRAKKEIPFYNQANLLVTISTSIAAIFLIPINIYAAIFSLGLSFFITNQFNFLGAKEYKNYFFITLTKSILLVVLPILFYFAFEIPGILLGMAISNFVVSFQYLNKLKIQNQNFNKIRENYKVVLHNFGVDASLTLPRMVDKLLILPILGFFVVGIYQFNMQILLAMEVLPLALHSFLLSEESSGESHKKIKILVIFLSGILALIAIFISPTIVEQFFPKFSEGIFSLQILIISIIPLTITYILSAGLQSKSSTKVGYSAIVRISSLLILILVLGNSYGLVGLAAAVLISNIINTIFLSILYRNIKY